MNVNQRVIKTRSPVAQQALAAMTKLLDSKKPVLSKQETMQLTVRRVAQNPPEHIPETVLHKLLLSTDQCNDLQLLQDLCAVIAKAVKQINVVSASHELRLPPLYLMELTDYMLRMDVLINAAKTAAKRLDVEAVQPKVNTEYLARTLQKDALYKRVKQLEAA